ncbi:MAG: peptidase MA family metallohydrolase [Candidatus Brocadiales bacterium]
MSKIITKSFVIFFFSLCYPYLSESIAQTQEHFHVVSELSHGEAYLSAWDVKQAARVADELLNEGYTIAPVQYFAGRVRFYEGNYAESLRLLKNAAEATDAFPGTKNFLELVENVYQTASKFQENTSPHFTFRYIENKDKILVDYALPALEKAYEEIGKDLDFFPEDNIIVEVYPDVDSFCKASTLTREEIDTSGTVAICIFNRLMITTPRVLLHGYGWLDTLAHEYVHYAINKKTRNRTPIWLHEGIAKYEEVRWRMSEGKGLSSTSESLLAEAIENDYFITFEQMHPSLAKLKTHEDTVLAFAEVHTAIEYILEKGGYDLLRKILELITVGESAENAVASALQIPFTQFEQEWQEHLRKRDLKKIPGIQVIPLHFKKDESDTGDVEDVSEIEAGNAKKHAKLGDILRRESRPDAAIVEYEKAYQVAGLISPQILNKLALAYLLNTQYKKAEEILITTRQYYPDYPTTYVTLGELYQRLKAYDKAIESLTLASQINPYNPFVHQTLFTLCQTTGKKEEAALHLKRTTILLGGPHALKKR